MAFGFTVVLKAENQDKNWVYAAMVKGWCHKANHSECPKCRQVLIF